MLKSSVALTIIAASVSADASAVGAMRLRGGGAPTWSSLTSAPDTLKEGYSTASKLEVVSNSDLNGGSTLKSTFTRSAANKITALFNAKTKYQGVDLEADLDGSGTITGSASYNEIVPGGKLKVSGVLEGGKAIKDMAAPQISGEYKKDNIMATGSVAGSSLVCAAVVDSGDFQVGASTSYDANDGSVGEPSFAAKYKGGNFAVTALVKGLKGDDVTATYTQTVSDELDVAGSFNTDGSKFAVGASYKLDGDSSVKGKINSDGILNVGYTRQVTKGTTLNAGLEMDTNNMDSRKIGVSLKCT